ncbi:MAG: elongation factor P [Candidatus Chisholmbacteria bacterium RIFCSPLOWO2_01_FULL_50_28]|uniref:Elongation factor P n=1 Tax=Candidatus Chisholmbacteria bacterium RIFCSPHIGHO2_01_FULL_52_32 TaxID=1797591 RepID=A0A1G1VU33_9BACT|nr:MAG: elongation factor P [Candidatus Chisholmbacteria bacterium RIFCSPHIGHO2_01_FULL_52_32]OGY20636.1 MAG: elongation factor P [Candidatus Chisholmbacteria bacterium RIFCSPLOWO2_01_FULL_50_28]
MISVTKLRVGVTFEHLGDPWRVIEYKHVHLSRGSGTITVRARNLRTGNVQTLAFRSGDRVEDISVERRLLTYLYKDGDWLVFMHPRNFEQSMVPLHGVGEGIRFVVEGQEAWVLFWEEKPLDVEIPPKVTLEVAEASPGVRGDTVAGATKDVVLITGMHLRVPLFIHKGDRVVVDTRTGKYVERAS